MLLFSSVVELRGQAVPEHGQLTPGPVSSRVKALADLGPEVTHTFEVTNLGPFDVGNLLVSQMDTLNWILNTFIPETLALKGQCHEIFCFCLCEGEGKLAAADPRGRLAALPGGVALRPVLQRHQADQAPEF